MNPNFLEYNREAVLIEPLFQPHYLVFLGSIGWFLVEVVLACEA